MDPLEKTNLVFEYFGVLLFVRFDELAAGDAPGALLVTYLDSFTALHKIFVICSRLSTR